MTPDVVTQCIFAGRSDQDCRSGQSCPTSGLRNLFDLWAVTPCQTHSTNVGVVTPGNTCFPDTDALITFLPKCPIGVRTADCVPLTIYCPDVRGVGVIHAGWKGTLNGIVDITVKTLEQYGAKPERMIVTFGPSISAAQYEVGHDLAEHFINAGFGHNVSWPNGINGKPHIDLQGTNMTRMLRLGVKRENIKLNPHCTFASINPDGTPRYESHRRSKGAPGRNLTLITLI